MAKSDIEMIPGTTIRIRVEVAPDAILTRGKSVLASMREPLERRARAQGVRLRRVRLTQDRRPGWECCVVVAEVVEAAGCASRPAGDRSTVSDVPSANGPVEVVEDET